jgi:SAM-dependent methyltransferase
MPSSPAEVAEQQRSAWGRRPRDWAALAEPENRPLFATVLEVLDVGRGSRLLDVGCGSGLALSMAARRGASVAGVDATPELLEIAAERVPGAELHAGPLEELPFADAAFDFVTGFNAFQFAADPVAAVREAARVARHPTARIAATTFAEPERNESTALHLAMKGLRAEAPGEAYAPYALSEPGGLESLFAAAGVEPMEAGEVPVVWGHRDVDSTIRAILASAGGALAIEAAGEEAASAALYDAIGPFVQGDGSVRMQNVFRYAVGAP